MHNIQVQLDKVSCSCGFYHDTITASEARRLGYEHGRNNTPSLIRDQTSAEALTAAGITPCSMDCFNSVGMAPTADEENWHHIRCQNHNDDCCAGTVGDTVNINKALRVSYQHTNISINSL